MQKVMQQNAMTDYAQNAWEDKRAAERPTEVPASRKHVIDNFTEIKSSWEAMKTSNIYPELTDDK